LELLPPEQIETLHNASMRILEEVGLDFLDDEALDLWRQAGAKVDRAKQHVWLDRALVLELVARAPTSFTWLARNAERNLTIGHNSINFSPQGGTVFVANLEFGRRPGRLEDYEKLLKLVHMCNVLHVTGEQMVVPHDVDISARPRLVFGDPLPADPVLAGVINVNSPLRYDDRMLGGLITLARAGQITIVTPFILAGAMSPITLASALAQQNAEALAGIALTQLVRPGAPVVYGGFTTNVDMKSGSPSFGTPEGAWAMAWPILIL
jgi:trimethylamine--corrinoid protein Co-methyltransferase